MTADQTIAPSATERNAPFLDGYWHSADGVRLHFRDYPGRADRPPIVCLPGLTRNARDFTDLAERLSGQWRVICPDLRGRGDSGYAKDSATYNPAQYVEDLNLLFAELACDRIVIFGTSLGGLLALLIALADPSRLAGVLLNDIGPQIEPQGLERIRGYVGQGGSYPTWMHAARALQESQHLAFPGYAITDWIAMAKRCMALGSNGRIHFDYDMKIAEPFAQPGGEAGVDLWPALGALKDKPVALIRGELSDILSADTLLRMTSTLDRAEAVTVKGVGHAPMLNEPEAIAAIDRLLGRIG